MKKDKVVISGVEMDIYSLNTVVVGSGAAGLNAADSLRNSGQKDIAVVTEGMGKGTSRNTGSDKQTYYKLNLSGNSPDSVVRMAQTLFAGGCMHGDIALVEAALSPRAFFKLVDIGVPFPHNRYGEYTGYKTDHDPAQRATSAGPLTSRYMTERLEEQVKLKGITVFDGFQVIGIITAKKDDEAAPGLKAIGLITLDLSRLDSPNMGFTLFNCTNIVYAVGGPAGIYEKSVYPESQMGATGIALEAGARGINITESQFGIASTKFRWNVSGTYQQVIPCYVSTDRHGGDEREFLTEYFKDAGKMLDAVFLKGYQWPFDPLKVINYGSSMVDILVYCETQIKGRKVFMDFTRNPCSERKKGELDFSLLGKEAYNYLEKSGALFGTPIQRLHKMNPPAVELYKCNGIDLNNEYLEIDVCAQHNNGGLLGNIWWESNIAHLFPVGEVNGTFGVYRPGGSALNSTQVGSLRAAQYIAANYTEAPIRNGDFISRSQEAVSDRLNVAIQLKKRMSSPSNVRELQRAARQEMTMYGAHIRSMHGCDKAIEFIHQRLKAFENEVVIADSSQLSEAFRYKDMLLAQFAYLCSIREYIKKGGASRGSYLVYDEKGQLPAEHFPEEFRFSIEGVDLLSKVCETSLNVEGERLECSFEWKEVRPVPVGEDWFENVWSSFRSGNIIK